MKQINTQSLSINKKAIYIGVSIIILWMGLGLSFCYEMGKHGIQNIQWNDIVFENIHLFIIAGFIFLLSFKKNQS